MPDLITHMVFSHLLKRTYELKQKPSSAVPFRIIFYFGTILPDIMTRPFYILFPSTQIWTVFFHTPFGAIVLCAFLSYFYAPEIQKRVFLNLCGGVLLHFLMDTFQHQIMGNSYWLFPFSWKSVNYSLYSVESLIPLIPVWIFGIVVFEGAIFWMRRKAS